MAGAQADAMKAAAANPAGAMNGFVGMGMAMNAGGGMNAQNLFAMGQQTGQQQAQTGSMEMCVRSVGIWQFLSGMRRCKTSKRRRMDLLLRYVK